MSCIDHGRTRSLSPEGYALVARPGQRSRCVGLHRIILAQKLGITLEGMGRIVCRHTCDNTRCVNPEHLIPGTRADNNRDRAERGRSAKTVQSRQRLNAEQVAFIKAHFTRKRGAPYTAVHLGKMFGVDSKVIYNVMGGNYNVG